MQKKASCRIFICSCCCGKKNIKYRIRCTNGHEFCTQCVRSYVTSQVTMGSSSNKCIAMHAEECTGKIPYDELKKAVPESLLKNWDRIDSINELRRAGVKNLVTCAHCGHTFQLFNKNRYLIKTCPTCGRGTCVKCGQPAHLGISCQKVRQKLEMRSNGVNFCPKCYTCFIRESGCNRIQCTSCGTYFCYLCHLILNPNDGYRHFSDAKIIPKGKCKLYSREHTKKFLKMPLNNNEQNNNEQNNNEQNNNEQNIDETIETITPEDFEYSQNFSCNECGCGERATSSNCELSNNSTIQTVINDQTSSTPSFGDKSESPEVTPQFFFEFKVQEDK
ncbi:hypothetical protein TRFO_21610 [Tritrichomonas foetus]|uniref:RING-type domain-containing protein n=1 Tax=Tritrichomonas foetus TaxID=1144522 RepID=A0A1J4KJL7_9EUKA|nr:hypothetical protein TRFO_21610 [Tritrichomonas foetus]|eukprot:OHT09549.1 hypothetical protein TRFO_21610 [Tritrichomonas foetus]